MSSILEAFTTLYPDQIWLEVSLDEIKKKWPLEQEYSYDVARWNAFLNRLTLDVFLRWIEEESGIKEQPEVWPSRDDLSSIWEVVNGTAIQLGETRIVLIPNEAMDTKEYEVPAEWVDIPSWTADYYLAVQVNPDDYWLRVWGYATHKKLKQVGQFDRIRRTYSLQPEELIEDLNIMWAARELGCDRKATIEPLPSLSPARAQSLLEQLSQKTPYSPRLEVPFAMWGTLLASDEWRQELYNRRVVPSKKLVDLRQWLGHFAESGQNLIEDGWQRLEDIFASPEPIAVRSQRGAKPTSPDAIAFFIHLLQSNQPEHVRRTAFKFLEENGAGNPDVINFLTELLHSAKNEKTRWQVALSLGKVDLENPLSGIRKAKLIDLGMQLIVVLSVTIVPKANGRKGVLLQVWSQSETTLPAGLKLSLLSETGETRQEVEATSDLEGRGKGSLTLPAFSPPPGTRFRVRVMRDDDSITKDFIV